MFEVKNISKTFTTKGGSVNAVKNVSFTVKKGDIVGIVGESGAGKSTLVRCLNLLERPEQGEILLNGQDIMKLSSKQLNKVRASIGMIFQHFNLMTQRNVFQNVAYPMYYKQISKDEIRKKALSLLDLVGIKDKAFHFPAQLSGGQKQRVAIARALAANPKILLCDEATSALDPKTTIAILDLIKDINKKLGLSVVMITHEKEVVQTICNKIIVLDKGEIVEANDALQVFTAPQSQAGKKFVGDILNDLAVREALNKVMEKQKYEKNYIMKLTFIGENSGEPVISAISKKFDIFIAILFGDIKIIQGETVGNLIVKISGKQDQIKQAVASLAEKNIYFQEVKKCDLAN